MNKIQLTGIWQLVSYKVTVKSSDLISYPYGITPKGYLIYTDTNFVSVHIMNPARPSPLSQDFRDTSDLEKIEMASNYGGYIGKYKIQGNKILHYPEISGFTSYLNQPQERTFDIKNNRLIIQYPYFDNTLGKEAVAELVWEKLND